MTVSYKLAQSSPIARLNCTTSNNVATLPAGRLQRHMIVS